MKFLAQTVTGKLILTRSRSRKAQPTRAVVAKSAKPVEPIIIRVALYILMLFRPAVATGRNIANRWPPQLSPVARQRIATLSFLGSVVLMVLAESYLDRALGVIA